VAGAVNASEIPERDLSVQLSGWMLMEAAHAVTAASGESGTAAGGESGTAAGGESGTAAGGESGAPASGDTGTDE
jgi:hypothetical protein